MQSLRWVVICLGLVGMVGGTRTSCTAAPPGFLHGHLKILSLKEVELAGNDGAPRAPSKTYAQNYSDYPLVIRSKESQKEVARTIADREGNYRIALPPGDYILDVQGRGPGGVRAEPQPFTVVSNQTVRVDMNIDTGIR